MKFKTTIIGLLTAGALAITGAGVANAEQPKVSLSEAKTQAQVEQALKPLLAGLVEKSETNKVFDYQKALNAGATKQDALDFAKGWMLAEGETLNIPAGKKAQLEAEVKPLIEEAHLQGCGVGRTRNWADGWGNHFEMNTCTSQNFINQAVIGVAVSQLVAVLLGVFNLPVGLLATLVNAIIGVGIAIFAGCQYKDGRLVGLTFHLGFHFAPWCGPQS